MKNNKIIGLILLIIGLIMIIYLSLVEDVLFIEACIAGISLGGGIGTLLFFSDQNIWDDDDQDEHNDFFFN